MKKRKVRIMEIGIVGIVIVLFTLTKGVSLTTDYLWFKSVDFQQIFTKELITKITLFIPFWIFSSFYLYMFTKHHFSTARKKFLRNISLGIGALFSLFASTALWLDLLKFINAESFGVSDPIFGRDIGFYFFTLPFISNVLELITVYLGFIAAGTLIYEVLKLDQLEASDVFPPGARFVVRMNKTSVLTSIHHIRYLLSTIFAVIGVRLWLRTYGLLYSTRGVTFGAGYTDVNVTLWLYRVLAVVSIVSIVILLYALKHKNIKGLIAIPSLFLVIVLGFNLTGLIVQKLIVEPDEITKERTYLTHNIEYTQKAFKLDEVTLVEYPYEETLTYELIIENDETIKNIRINDERPLNQTFNQIQSIRLYYDFNDIDIDRYHIDGEYTQVFIAARELDQYKLDNKAMTWINQYLKYTHGYGIVMAPVNKVTNEGQPELLFKNIPPITSTNLSLTRPEIYFGEQTNNYIIVNTDEKEFDYPSGSDNVETVYSGDSGITLTPFNRLLFSIRENSMKLLVSGNIDSESRIIINRNILERVNEIAPFLSYDSNPYIVLNTLDGKLYWIIDAYTVSNQYPYSEYYTFNNRAVNYIRNSVKVVIDTYTGETGYYIYDEKDPLVQTYSNIFPDLFQSKEDFPEGLKAHVKYPQDFFNLQSNVFTKYHVDNPVVFYNGEDLWDIATEKYMDAVQTIQSNYVMFKIDEAAEFSLILPYTPKEKPNMTSLLIARNDEPNYGEVLLYRFPKDKTIQGPIMIESRIDQDSVISPQFTLWGQQGSRVLRGNVIVVPIANSLLYVEPIYIQSDNKDSLPEMKRVILVYNDTFVMEQTLEAGLKRLFAQEDTEEPPQQSTDVDELLNEINTKFNLSKELINELELLIDALEEQLRETQQSD